MLLWYKDRDPVLGRYQPHPANDVILQVEAD
jgi:hypothetical protein